MAVIPALEVPGEAFADELRVNGLEAGQYSSKKRLDPRRTGGVELGYKGFDGRSWARIDCVDANTQDDLIIAVGIDTLRKYAPYLDIGSRVSWFRRVKSI